MPEQVRRLTSGDGIQLGMYRYTGVAGRDPAGRKPVLMLHGASASHLTFTTPYGGLAKWLSADFDPWLLDWRGSGRIVDDPANAGSLKNQPGIYNFNRAAEDDVPLAIEAIREETGCDTIGALGFCMGSAVLAEFVARGSAEKHGVDCLVLMALGLFYETPIDGRLKAEEHLLERLARNDAGDCPVLAVDPRTTPWEKDLEHLYGQWPSALKSHDDPRANPGTPDDVVRRMCNRLSFMYGMPYNHPNLVSQIHGTDRQPGDLPDLFGAIPIQMYIHGGRNIRRGYATVFDPKEEPCNLVSDEARRYFRKLKRATLITGTLNRLWHRDSIDRMYEWLCAGSSLYLEKFHKHIIPKYAHQDLLWGRNAARDVFGLIKAGLS